MNLRSLLMPCGAFGVALALVLSGTGEAYNLLGGSLDLGQRDFRVFNNFSDPEANDNLVTQPAFPEATGAVRAIWAAVAEWGSELRKDGSGDPSQPGGLGSGGANFDSSFQGLAPDPGTTNDNVFSEISGQSGGVLAFTELPASDGWRIRFYRAPTIWHDGPGSPSGSSNNDKDLQGVACHEYGHALGLDHSTLSFSLTMFPGSSTNFVGRRSLELDDIAGVQAIYGVKSLLKPHIASYLLNGNQVTIFGDHFDPNANEVWFTRSGAAGDGTPVIVSAIPSSAGATRLDLSLPSQAGSGDLLVRVPGLTGDKLSNAYPFDSVLGDCAGAQTIGTPKTNSLGLQAILIASGSLSATFDNLQLDVVFGGIPNATAILFHGTQAASLPFFGGTLYAGGALHRDAQLSLGFLGDGSFPIPITPSMVGQTHYYQLWYQDSADAFGVGLSGGLAVTFCP